MKASEVKVQSNGHGKTEVKPAGNGNGKTTVTQVPPTLPKVEEKEAPKPLTGIEAALSKVERLSHLVRNREQVNETLSKLRAFRPEISESNTTLTITDSNGKKFTTTNSEHIAAVIQNVVGIADAKKAEFERELTQLAA